VFDPFCFTNFSTEETQTSKIGSTKTFQKHAHLKRIETHPEFDRDNGRKHTHKYNHEIAENSLQQQFESNMAMSSHNLMRVAYKVLRPSSPSS